MTEKFSDLTSRVFGEDAELMADELSRLGLEPRLQRFLIAHAAVIVELSLLKMEQLSVRPSDADRELKDLVQALGRARNCIKAMGPIGRHRLQQGLAQVREEPVSEPDLMSLVDVLTVLHEAGRRARATDQEDLGIPTGAGLARYRKSVITDALEILARSFESLTGRRPPRSWGLEHPWFAFVHLATKPIGAPDSEDGFRHYFFEGSNGP